MVFRAVVMVSASALSVAAHAQTTPPVSPQAVNGSDVDSGEIVVTAQRREERLQDVGIAVAAYSADTASNISFFNRASRPRSHAPSSLRKVPRMGVQFMHASAGVLR
jgi:hypothetical protein